MKEKNSAKVNINWYPGHMAKTKRQIIEDLKLIDIVAEILDARIPISSRNPDIEQYIKDKDRLILLNKSDLADEEESNKWISYFNKNGISAIRINSNSGDGIKQAIKKMEDIYLEKQELYKTKGRIGKSIRVMVLGIPNVGKSSFINRISKKSSALVGNKPGVTKQKQWIRVNKNIELLDTPGVLWPKFENEQVALNLAYTGSIKDDLLEITEIGFQFLKFMLKEQLQNIVQRYKLNLTIVNNILNKEVDENDKILEIMHLIGEKRGAMLTGGDIDEEKISRILLDDFRSGKLGRITLEKVK